jgi:hypothetical protein
MSPTTASVSHRETPALLADVRRLSREYFERIHRCSSDGKSNQTT